jgi:hypothetical protein
MKTKHIDALGNFSARQRNAKNKNLKIVDNNLTRMLFLKEALEKGIQLLDDLKSRLLNDQELPESFNFAGVSGGLDKVVPQNYDVMRCDNCNDQVILSQKARGRYGKSNKKRFCRAACRTASGRKTAAAKEEK